MAENGGQVEKIQRVDVSESKGITGGQLSEHIRKAMFASEMMRHLNEIDIDGSIQPNLNASQKIEGKGTVV